MRERRSPRLFVSATLAIGFALAAAVRAQGPPVDPTETVRAFADAFAAREVDALVALTHSEIEWLSVSGAEVEVETRGRDALRTWLRSYYDSCPSCRSETEIYQVVGPYVSVLERAGWEKDGAPQRAASLAVYEVVDGLVRRVWYFPSSSEPAEGGAAPPGS